MNCAILTSIKNTDVGNYVMKYNQDAKFDLLTLM